MRDFWALVSLPQTLFAMNVLHAFRAAKRGFIRARAAQLLRPFLMAGKRLGPLAGGGLALVLLAAAPAGPIHSDLFIEPGKQFILGGGQRGAFRVAAKNVGPVPVEIKERPRGGGIFGKAALAPGQRAVLHFAAGSTAVLLNPGTAKANLDLTITGDTNLGMTYEPVGQAAPAAPATDPPK